MKKSLSLFLTLTMAMVLSVSAPSVVCAGTATPRASIEQGKINPEKIYIKSTDLPAFALGNMKAADEAARAKYKHDDQGRPVFYELNAKTNLWMNSENIKGVDGFKSDYEIKQEALAVQKNKLKKPYQAKIDEAARKRDEALAELERKKNGEFTDEEVFEYCQKRAQEQAEGTDMEGVPAQPTAMCLGDYGRREMQEQAEADYENKKREIEEQYENEVADSQSKVNEIDAAKDAEELGKVKADQDQDLANKKAEAAEKQAEADAAEENAKQKEAEVEDLQRKANGEFTEDEVRAYCEQRSEGFGTSRGTANCAEYGPEEMKAEAEAELNGQYGEGGKLAEAEEARREADAARAEADKAKTAADAAEKKVADDLKNENEIIKNTLYEHDRFGGTKTTQNEDKTMDEKVAEAVEKEMNSDEAKLAIDRQAMENVKNDSEYNDVNAKIDATVSDCLKKDRGHNYCTHENIAARNDDFKDLVTQRDQIYESYRGGAEKDYRNSITERHRTELKKENDLAKEVMAISASTADYTGISFNKPKDNKRQMPSDEGTNAITSGESN